VAHWRDQSWLARHYFSWLANAEKQMRERNAEK
jgi:hypothetical protein